TLAARAGAAGRRPGRTATGTPADGIRQFPPWPGCGCAGACSCGAGACCCGCCCCGAVPWPPEEGCSCGASDGQTFHASPSFLYPGVSVCVSGSPVCVFAEAVTWAVAVEPSTSTPSTLSTEIGFWLP